MVSLLRQHAVDMREQLVRTLFFFYQNRARVVVSAMVGQRLSV